MTKNLTYGTEADEAKHLEIRKVMYHDEQNDQGRSQLEQVRCFMSNVKWKVVNEDDTTDLPGITWLELYIYYAIHGGCEQIKDKQRTQPLKNTETLQTAISHLKNE